VSSIVDIAIASTLAVSGFAMAPIPFLFVAGTLAAAALFALALDLIKVPVFAHLGIAEKVATAANADGPKSEPTSTAQSAPTQTPPANAKRATSAAPALETKTEGNPNAKSASPPDIESKAPSDLTPKLVERVHAMYEELGRQDVLAVQEFEQVQKTSKEKAVQ
jgi:hypothetical protein